MPATLLALFVLALVAPARGQEPPPQPVPSRVEKIRFEGNARTCDRLLRGQLTLDEGDVLDLNRVQHSMQRLDALPSIRVAGPPEVVPVPERPDAIELTFRVAEEEPTPFGLGGTLGGAEGFSLSGSLTGALLLHCGERLEASLQGGDRIESYQLLFAKPYAFGRDWTLGGEVLSRHLQLEALLDQGVPAYDDERTGFRLGAELALRPASALIANYTYLAITTRSADPGGVPASAFGPRRESELGLGWARDTFALAWPRRGGFRMVVRAGLAGGPLGGSVKLFESRVGLMTEVPLTERTALSLRAGGAWITGWGKTETIPYDRRYSLGGPHEIRGFEPRSVGPRDAQGRLVGGSSQLSGGAEYIVDITRRVQVLGFVDSGQAFGEGAAFRLEDLRVSTGVELRVRLPLLSVPLRVLYAATLRRDPVHGRGGFSVALGLPTVP